LLEKERDRSVKEGREKAKRVSHNERERAIGRELETQREIKKGNEREWNCYLSVQNHFIYPWYYL
jgi:hypothetical protein